jgi:hypothetical protein
MFLHLHKVIPPLYRIYVGIIKYKPQIVSNEQYFVEGWLKTECEDRLKHRLRKLTL